MSEVLEPRAVVGTWRLAAYERHSADGAVSFPLGEDSVGYLAYTPMDSSSPA
jgi:hypothetical protein